MVPEIVPAHNDHIDHVVRGMRRPDRLELFLAYGEPPRQVLQRSLDVSRISWTGLIDGEPVCMFGVAPGDVLSGIGHPWMVGTGHLDRHPFVFLRRCKGCVREMLTMFSTLENYAHQDNIKALEWLMWLGFAVTLQAEPMGPYRAAFCRFVMRRK